MTEKVIFVIIKVLNIREGKILAEHQHNGHRSRMKSKFLDNGLDVFKTHEVLEMLLYYAYPRVDTNSIAHKLIDHFGSLSAVFDAPVDTLIKFGMTENTAVLIKLIPDLLRVYLEDKHNNKNKVINLDHVGDYFVPKFIGRENETVILLLLDSKGKELFCGAIEKGTVNATNVTIRKIVDFALRYNTCNAYIAHNHPSGVALPSRDDIITTKKIYSALNFVGVRLVDHFIVADNDYVSLAESSFGPEIFRPE